MVVEPKAKKEKEKDAAFKELVTIGKAMVEGDLLEKQSLEPKGASEGGSYDGSSL